MTDRIDYHVPEGLLIDDIDGFHVPSDDDWLQLETNWVWFFVPERRLGCWIYHFIRPSIGLQAGSIQVWDHTAWHHSEIPYHHQVLYGQLPEERDLHDFTFSTGFRWTMLEPRQRYRLRYDDEGVCTFDLEWSAIMDPWLPLKGDPPRNTHLDQWGHVTGQLVLHGETIAVDCYAMRDRSWQLTRPDGVASMTFWGGQILNGWMAAAADASTAFFGTKWIVLDGHLSPVVESEVRRERDREHGFLRRIIITARDEEGRELEAIGESVSRLIAPVPNTNVVSVNSLMDYRINGIQAWGDDQDSWALSTWAAMRRRQMGLTDARSVPPNTGEEI